ncbi:MAG TPA: hypothetical protein PK011_00550 [Marinagarivorans sp.]|nr:hypothetical protein [Marinagarivorans sp.]HNG58421.1 hypothetical protein [Cellvibrionaceae bacterium]
MSYKNLKKPNFRFLPLLALAFSLGLAGCGSGGKKGEGLLGEPVPKPPVTSSSSSGAASSTSSGGSTVGSYTDSETGSTVNVTVASEEGEVAFGVSKKITLTFKDSAGKVFEPKGISVEASSNCITTLKGATISTPTLNSNVMTFSYTNQGCRGDDWVYFTSGTGTAVAKLGSVKMVTIGESVASIQFIKADPSKIYVAGDSTPKESVLTFKVLGQGGKPLENEPVVFSNSGTSGGITLITSSDNSDKDGLVEVRVKAGTVPTTVSIKALHEKSKVEGFSGGLEVSAAMPVESTFAIGATKYNIRSYGRINDETTQIVARVSDSAGGYVPDGTTVRFETREGGSIESCKTVNGTCTSTWIPSKKQPLDGRVQVMAYVQGVEEFKDNNSNNVFDDGDTFVDLPEPFSDDNQNGQYDIGEFFADANNNGKRDVADGKWNGVNCKHSSLCAPASQLVNLSKQLTLFLSYGAFEICEPGDFAKTIWVKPKGVTTVGGMFISDGNGSASNEGHPCKTGNPLPNGTKITFTPSGGSLKGGSGVFTVGADEGLPKGPLGVIYEAPDQAGPQFLTMKIEIPGMLEGSRTWPIVVSDTPPDDSNNIPDANTAGTFIDPTLNQKVWVDIAAPAGQVMFDTSKEVTLTFKDEQSLPKTLTSAFSATSACIVSSRSQISAPNVSGNTVKFTYTAKGCVGDDVVTFNAQGGGKTVTVGSYKFSAAGEAVGGITFVSASPTQIPISTTGSGSGVFATVTFKVLGQSGNGVAGENVRFSIVGEAGGVELVTLAAVSDLNGLVKTQVKPGTTPNNVTVLATVESNGAKASSLGLAVASGLSAPGRFSIALSSFNPHAYNFDSGIDAVTVSATVADASGNPVIDGTLVNFVSPEGGLITPTCLTVKGRCAVGFQSTGIQPKDGRLRIAAYVKGVEHFIDVNGNLIFDDNDIFDLNSDDTYEPYVDENDDGSYQLGEYFVDSVVNGVRDGPDGKWNGLNCAHSSLCGAAKRLVDIQDTAVVNLSGYSGPTICQAGTFGNGSVPLTVAPGGTLSLSGLYLSDGNPFAVNLSGACATGNSLPGGTKVTFAVSSGATLLSPKDPLTVTPYERQPNGSYYAVFTAPTTPGVVVLTMKIEVPPYVGSKDTAAYIYNYNWTIDVK